MTTQSKPATRISIAQDMTIYNAAELKQLMTDALSVHETLEIDFSGVAEIDTSGVQLLILLKREALRLGRTVRFVAHSAAVREVIDFFNLGAGFGDPMLIPASDS